MVEAIFLEQSIRMFDCSRNAEFLPYDQGPRPRFLD